MMKLKDYLKENWDGWPLHVLIAVGSMYQTKYLLLMVLVNAVFWPSREAEQHDGFKDIWTWHRVLEWSAPIVACIVYYFTFT